MKIITFVNLKYTKCRYVLNMWSMWKLLVTKKLLYSVQAFQRFGAAEGLRNIFRISLVPVLNRPPNWSLVSYLTRAIGNLILYFAMFPAILFIIEKLLFLVFKILNHPCQHVIHANLQCYIPTFGTRDVTRGVSRVLGVPESIKILNINHLTAMWKGHLIFPFVNFKSQLLIITIW